MSRNNFLLSNQPSEPPQPVVERAQIESHQAASEDLDGLLVGTVVGRSRWRGRGEGEAGEWGRIETLLR